MVIDTGAQANIGNLALLRRLGNGKRLTQEQGSLISVTGQSIDVNAGLAQDFRIGRAQFEYVSILFTDSKPLPNWASTRPQLCCWAWALCACSAG